MPPAPWPTPCSRGLRAVSVPCVVAEEPVPLAVRRIDAAVLRRGGRIRAVRVPDRDRVRAQDGVRAARAVALPARRTPHGRRPAGVGRDGGARAGIPGRATARHHARTAVLIPGRDTGGRRGCAAPDPRRRWCHHRCRDRGARAVRRAAADEPGGEPYRRRAGRAPPAPPGRQRRQSRDSANSQPIATPPCATPSSPPTACTPWMWAASCR